MPRGPSLYKRIFDRTQQELGFPRVPTPPEDERSFFRRVKDVIQKGFEDVVPGSSPPVIDTPDGPAWVQPHDQLDMFPQEAPAFPQGPEFAQRPPANEREVIDRINAAGARLLLLRMKYNGHSRDVEPYSIRDGRAANGGPLFYGWCHKDQQIEAFRLDRIEDLQIKDQKFAPRNGWPVEFPYAG